MTLPAVSLFYAAGYVAEVLAGIAAGRQDVPDPDELRLLAAVLNTATVAR